MKPIPVTARAFKILFTAPGFLRLFCLSLVVSCLVFGLIAWGALGAYDSIVGPKLASWFGNGTAATVIGFILKVNVIACFALFCFFAFGTVNGIICLPILDLLSEATEVLETGRRASYPFLPGLVSGLSTAITAMAAKIVCYVLALPLLFVPGLGAAVFFAIGAWFASLDFLDIPMSRRGWTGGRKKKFLAQRRIDRGVFGSAMLAMTMVPLLNIVAPAVGAVAGTLLFIEYGGIDNSVAE